MSEKLELALLGHVEIRHGGRPMTQIVGKTLALLCYLAVTGRSHNRSTLAGLLWGGMPEAKARGNLSKALSTLRRSLGEHLTITRQTVALDAESDYWLDVETFEASAKGAVPKGDVEQLQEAVQLYRGDFLDGLYVRDALEFEEWLLAQRARLRELAVKALYNLAAHYADRGATGQERAIAYIAQLLRLEPWREEAHRQMMLLLALNGQRGAALAQYETCRQVLDEALGVAPGTETTALYEQIRNGQLRRGEVEPAPSLEKLRPSPTVQQPPAPLPDFLQTPAAHEPAVCVAREAELARLDRLLERALAGQGRVAFVIGEPGSGKTVLIEDFIRRALAKETDLVAAVGNCNAYGGIGDPYLPFREILALLTGDVQARWRAGAISHKHARRLWTLIPEAVQALVSAGPALLDIFVSASALRDRAAMATPSGELAKLLARQEADQAQINLEQADLFEMYTQVLQSLARQRPIVLILDDLQWADVGSISLLFHLGRRLTGQRLLVVGVYRPSDVALGRGGERHPLEPVIHEFQRLFGNIMIDLGQVEGKHFVESILNTEANRLCPAFRDALHRHTRGHALFTVEIVKGMQERGDLVQDEQGRWVEGAAVDWENLPARVEGVIAERIARLSPTLHETLEIASVEGEFFTAEVVAQVQGLDKSEIIRRLSGELGRKHRLVKSRDRGQVKDRHLSHYRFRHILFQKYLYNQLDGAERTWLHKRVGDELERLYQGQTEEIAVHLARHFRGAGMLEKAIGYWQQAGDVAARAYANAEAISHYTQALELAKQVGLGGKALNLVYTCLGRALELDSQFEQALATYEDMERAAQQYGDRAMELASLTARVTIQAVPTAVHDPVRAQALGKKALALARELSDPAAQAKILWNLALAYYLGNRPARAIECGERSLALAREQDLREQMAQTLNDLGSFCYMYSGRLERAKEALREASALWRELGNLPMLADSLASAAIAHVFAGEFDQAVALADQAHEISLSIGNLWGQSYSCWKVGLAYWERGNWGQAILTMQESIRLGELAGFLPPQANTRAELAALYGELGAIARALETARLALQVAETQNPAQIGHNLGVLARLQLLDGDVAGAQVTIESAKDDPYRASWPVNFCVVALAEAELALRRGESKLALTVTEALLTELRQYGMRLHIPYTLYLQAQALRGLDQEQAARDRLSKARAEAEAIGSRRALWRILIALSQLEDDAAEARSLRQRAREIVAYIADHIDQADLRASFLNLPDVRAVLESA